MKKIVEYWKNNFDWRKQEAELNKFPQFKTKIEGIEVHFLRVKPKSGIKGKHLLPVADPRFPVGGGANLVSGVPTPNAAMFHKICMSKRKNWDPYGGRAPGAPPWIRHCLRPCFFKNYLNSHNNFSEFDHLTF